MRSSRLDRRVRREAAILVKDARAALEVKRGLRGKAGDLDTAVTEVEAGLEARDLQRVRRGLPTLDSLVDELVKRPAKSTMRDYVESILFAVLIALALRAFVIEAFKIPSSSMYPTLEIGDHIFVNKFLYGVRIPWTNTKLFELRGPKRGEVIVFMQPCLPDRDYIKRVVATENQTVEVRCNVVYVDGQPIPNEQVAEPNGDAACSYDDQDEGGAWETKKCSRYRETVGDFVYDTFHDRDRPTTKYDEPFAGDSRDYPISAGIPPSCSHLQKPCELYPNDPKCDGYPAPNQNPGEIVVVKERDNSSAPCSTFMHYKVPPGHVFVMGDNRANSNDSRYWGSVPIENIKGKALFIWLSYRDSLLRLGGIRWSRIGNFVH